MAQINNETDFPIRSSDAVNDRILIGYDNDGASPTGDVNVAMRTSEIFRNGMNAAAVPSSSSDTGTAGQIAYDTDFIYICVATNTWRRSLLTTF